MDSYIKKKLQSWNMRGVLAVETVTFLKIAWRFSSVNLHVVAVMVGLDERAHPLLGRAKVNMIKKSSEIMPLSACISSRVYGVELTGTPWIISTKVEVATQGRTAHWDHYGKSAK
jgi:hypothetical protein